MWGRAATLKGQSFARIVFPVRTRSPRRTPRAKTGPMRILLTNDDGIHAAGLKLLELIAGELASDDAMTDGRAGKRSVRACGPFAILSDPLRLREIGPRHFASERHADRLRHYGGEKNHGRPSARSRPFGGQPGPERRRGRDLLGHHRRRDGRGALGDSLDRPVAGLRRSGWTAKNRMGGDGNPCRADHSHDSGVRASPRAASSTSTFPLAQRPRWKASSSTRQGRRQHRIDARSRERRGTAAGFPYF